MINTKIGNLALQGSKVLYANKRSYELERIKIVNNLKSELKIFTKYNYFLYIFWVLRAFFGGKSASNT